MMVDSRPPVFGHSDPSPPSRSSACWATYTVRRTDPADPAFAAVIFDIDGVVTDTAAWTPPLPLNVVGTKACTWAERGR
jgi:hypothetical protein